MKLSTENLVSIARGAAFLGTGGGGDPYIGRMLAASAIQTFGMPELIAPEDLDDDATVVSVAMVGAPTVLTEKAACGDDVDLAIRRLEATIGRKADALLPIEIGGVNSMIPIMAAARLKLPLIDADGMGRAFPELQMVTFNVFGVSCTPAVVTDDHLNTLVIETHNAKRAEDLVRVASVEMGCSVIMASYPMRGLDVKQFGVHGTLTLARNIGEAIERGRSEGDPVEALLRYLQTTDYYKHSKIIFDGKVTDLRRETRQGFTMGHCTLAPLSGSPGSLELSFQNEFIVARHNGALRAVVPDLICVVDRETAEPVPVEALKYGQRLKVLGISAAPVLRTAEALDIMGPRCFGLDDDFVPIESINESTPSEEP
ncbi:MAG: DUF917 domain-containing protein [Pseudomonadota bacterium]